MTGSLNSNPLNSIQLNGEAAAGGGGGTVVATFSGTLIEVEQVVREVFSGTVIEIEQEVEFRETFSGTLVSVEQEVTETFSGTLVEVEQTVYNPNATDNVTKYGWDLIVNIAGVDYSDKLFNSVSISAEEASSRIADFSIIPDDGVQNLSAWIGQTVTIDIRRLSGIDRLFTGVIDIPEIDLIDKVIQFRCTQRRVELINNNLTSFVKNVGYFSDQVFKEVTDTNDELEKRLSTVPQSLDFDGTNTYYLTNWEPKATPDFTINNIDVLRRKPELEILRRGKLVNKIEIDLEYRYTRLHQRELTFRWSSQHSICDVLLDGHTLAQKSIIKSAADGTGWKRIGNITFGDLYDAGWYKCGATEGTGFSGYVGFSTTSFTYKQTAKTDALGNNIVDANGNQVYEAEIASATDYSQVYAISANWKATKRWAQTVQEQYTTVVKAPQSISQYGIIERKESFGYEDSFNASSWEQNESGDSRGTYYEDQNANYSKFIAATQVVLNRAKTKILSGHRENFTRLERDIWPEIDLRHTIEVAVDTNSAGDTAGFNTVGKVIRIDHEFNIGDDRDAVTTVETSSFTSQGSTTEDALSTPTRPTDSVNTTFADIRLGSTYGQKPTADMTGFIGNRIVDGRMTNYPVSFVVDTPAIEAEYRETRQIESTASYNIEIPNNTFTVTF